MYKFSLILITQILFFSLNAQELTFFEQGGKYGFKNNRGQIIVQPKYEKPAYFIDGYAKVVFNKKVGLIDKNGNEILPTMYDDVTAFKNGYASVNLGGVGSFLGFDSQVDGGKWGIVNTRNQIIIPIENDKVSTVDNAGIVFIKKGEESFYRDINGRYLGVRERWVANQPEGARMFFHERGATASIINTNKAGRRDGESRFFSSPGKFSLTENYKDGVLHGKRTLYFTNGKPRWEEAYLNGEHQNLVTFFHPNGKVNGIEFYEQDKYKGPGDSFDSTGKPTMTNGNGTLIRYHENGNLRYKAQYQNYLRNGKAEWFHENGKLSQAAIYKLSSDENGRPEELRWEIISSFNDQGKALEKGTLKEGNGTWISWEGNTKSVTTYKNGREVQ